MIDRVGEALLRRWEINYVMNEDNLLECSWARVFIEVILKIFFDNQSLIYFVNVDMVLIQEDKIANVEDSWIRPVFLFRHLDWVAKTEQDLWKLYS